MSGQQSRISSYFEVQQPRTKRKAAASPPSRKEEASVRRGKRHDTATPLAKKAKRSSSSTFLVKSTEDDADDDFIDDGDDDEDDDPDFGHLPLERKRQKRETLSKQPVAEVSSPSPRKMPSKSRTTVNATPKSSRLSFAEKTKQNLEAPQGEERYGWLINIRDEHGNSPDSPHYDPSTLYIPSIAYNALKPFEQQFWDVKKKHFDTVVFFKKGKFFELYEMDADIGHKEFDLKMTDRVNMRMVGVPESSFNDWAAKFLAKGYKITKVEQKESSKDLKERRGKGIKTKGS